MAAFALALFLTGTHWCMVGVVASGFGARISCMAPARAEAGSCHATPAASHCAQAAAAGEPAAAGRATQPPAGTPPCCVALAPALSAPGVKLAVDTTAPVLSAPVSTGAPAPVLASWHGFRVTRDAGPPALHARAPLSSRAPPLA
jgi:hypothetical protein